MREGYRRLKRIQEEPTESSKQPIRARYLDHVTGYQPIRDQYFLIRSVPGIQIIVTILTPLPPLPDKTSRMKHRVTGSRTGGPPGSVPYPDKHCGGSSTSSK